MTAGSERDGVLKGGGFATPDLETAAVFVGNDCVCSQREMCVPVQSKRVASAVGKGYNGSPIRSRVLKTM